MENYIPVSYMLSVKVYEELLVLIPSLDRHISDQFKPMGDELGGSGIARSPAR